MKPIHTTKEVDEESIKGVVFSEDHAALVMWSLKREENRKRNEASKTDYSGSLMVIRVGEISGVEASGMILESTKFSMKVVENEEKEKEELTVKLQIVLKAYGEIKRETSEKDKIIVDLRR